MISLALRQVGYNLATDIRSRKNENGKYAAYLEILPEDTTPPVTKATILGETGEGGAYKGKVNITFDVTDQSNGELSAGESSGQNTGSMVVHGIRLLRAYISRTPEPSGSIIVRWIRLEM